MQMTEGQAPEQLVHIRKQGSQDELKSFSVQLRGLQLRFRAFGYCKWRGFKETQDSFQSFPNGMVVDGP